MKPKRTITPSEMRGLNRIAIFDIIRSAGAISRTAIAEKLGASLPTVMRIVDELEAEGLVRPGKIKEFSGGRRRPQIEFNAESHLAIGIDLGGTKIYGGVADLGGNMLEEITVPHNLADGESGYNHLVEIMGKLIDFARDTGHKLHGIGIGVPGTVRFDEGIVETVPSLKWKNLPLKRLLEERFNLPVMVENDLKLSALGEAWFGVGKSVHNLVLIAFGTGVGAGVVIDGEIYRGSHHNAGEIGWLLPDRSFLGQHYEGFGPLEHFSSGTVIAERGRAALKAADPTADGSLLSAEDVFDAYRQGRLWAKEVVEESIDCLALAVSAVGMCFDPEVVVLGGGAARNADWLVESILKRLEGTTQTPITLLTSTLGYRAAVMGSIIHLMYYSPEFLAKNRLS